MLMVIFGAGASYDSAPDYPAVPSGATDSAAGARLPLANDLFVNRVDFRSARMTYPEINALIPSLIQRGGLSVEKVMQRYQGEAGEDPHRHSQLLAVKYYLRHMLSDVEHNWHQSYARGITNHLSLLDQIRHNYAKKEAVCLVTFNYDTLIERDMLTMGAKVESMADYIGNKQFKLFKLHGSVNWYRRINSGIMWKKDNRNYLPPNIIAHAAQLEVSSTFEMTIKGQPPSDGNAWYPAIAIPVEAKKDFECPEGHLFVLESLIPQITRILTVGWRATEGHFLARLKERLSKSVEFVACSGSPAGSAETVANIRDAGIDGVFDPLNAGFTEMVASNHLEAFFKSA